MGLEWGAILIPIVASVFLHYKYKHLVAWWEVSIPIMPALIIIPLVSYLGRMSAVSDIERHGGWVEMAEYFEDWDEYISQTCSTTDKDGVTTTYDCSYVDYHPPYWQMLDSNGETTRISQDEFEMLARKFKNRVFVDMHRWYYMNDGDKYVVHHSPGSEIQPVVTEHRFENRTLASHAVVDYPTVDPKNCGLYAYPRVQSNLNDPAILGGGDSIADHSLQILNATIGRRCQCRIWIVVFRGKPVEAGFDQESFWKGGKKNELVVTIGLDKSGVAAWCHPFCWSPDGHTGNDVLKSTIRNEIVGSELNLQAVVDSLGSKVPQLFKRKSFAEFKYIRIDVPRWAFILVYVLTILATGGCCYYVLENEHYGDPTGPLHRYLPQRFRTKRKR